MSLNWLLFGWGELIFACILLISLCKNSPKSERNQCAKCSRCAIEMNVCVRCARTCFTMIVSSIEEFLTMFTFRFNVKFNVHMNEIAHTHSCERTWNTCSSTWTLNVLRTFSTKRKLPFCCQCLRCNPSRIFYYLYFKWSKSYLSIIWHSSFFSLRFDSKNFLALSDLHQRKITLSLQ